LQKEVEMQKKLLDNTLEQLNNEHIRKYQEIEKEHTSALVNAKGEAEQYKGHCKELVNQIQKLKEKCDEQKEMLKNSKETISGMIQKENTLMQELEKKINELKEHQEGWRRRTQEVREEKD
jgi:chromosome segregation ATPase